VVTPEPLAGPFVLKVQPAPLGLYKKLDTTGVSKPALAMTMGPTRTPIGATVPGVVVEAGLPAGVAERLCKSQAPAATTTTSKTRIPTTTDTGTPRFAGGGGGGGWLAAGALVGGGGLGIMISCKHSGQATRWPTYWVSQRIFCRHFGQDETNSLIVFYGLSQAFR